MATGGARPVGLILAASSAAAAVALAVVLAFVPGDWRTALFLVGAAGCGFWVAGVLRARPELIATGVMAIGIESLLALAAARHPPAGTPLLGPALLVAAEAAFLSVELRPLRDGAEAALVHRALRVGAIAVGGWLAGVLVLAAGDAAGGPETVLDAVAVAAVAALATGVLWALRASRAG